jgi:hypothetical protein
MRAVGNGPFAGSGKGQAMEKRNLRQRLALGGATATVVALMSATVAVILPTDPCYADPPPPSCFGPTTTTTTSSSEVPPPPQQ